jgi:hypothetical protein
MEEDVMSELSTRSGGMPYRTEKVEGADVTIFVSDNGDVQLYPNSSQGMHAPGTMDLHQQLCLMYWFKQNRPEFWDRISRGYSPKEMDDLKVK